MTRREDLISAAAEASERFGDDECEEYAKRLRTRRLLITGSRNWEDREIIRNALLEHGPGTVIEGEAPGADRISREEAKKLGWPVEKHPAKWSSYGRGAGVVRNQEMVDAGADVCLAFPLPGSKGTPDCMRRAEAAGIPVHNYGPDPTVVPIRR